MAATQTLLNGRPKAYKVLGDIDDYVADVSQAVSLEQSQELLPLEQTLTVSTADLNEFPEDVWQAATHCPDEGLAVLRSYKDVERIREMYRQQLETLTLRQTQQIAGPTFLSGAATGKLPPLVQSTRRKTLSQAIKETGDLRKLSKFEQQQRIWVDTVMELAQRTGHLPEDLAMQRGPEWRGRLETLEELLRAMPLEDRVGGADTWSMSLRGAWERVVPIGGLFSGLFLTVKEAPAGQDLNKGGTAGGQQYLKRDGLMKVGRPLDPAFPGGPTTLKAIPNYSLTGTGSARLGRSLTRRCRDWAASEVLRSRLEQYSSRLTQQFPYQPDMGSLVVKGESFAVRLASILAPPISLEEVERHMEATDPEAYQAYLAAQQQYQEEQAAAAAEAAAEAVAAAAAAAQGSQVLKPGVHVECSTQHLLLHCSVGASSSGSFTLTNQGTAAVHYQWQRLPAELPPLGRLPASTSTAGTSLQQGPATGVPAAPLPVLSQAGPSAPSAPPSTLEQQQPLACLHLRQGDGVLLPGHSTTFDVLFTPAAPGVFTETWGLACTPRLSPPEQGDTSGAGGGSTSPVIEVQVRGVSAPEDTSSVAVAALDADLAQKEKMNKVMAVVERLLADVAPQQPTVPADDPAASPEAASFDAANVGAWPPLYYPGPAMYAQLAGLYTEARTALVSALTASAPPEDPKAKKAAAAKGGKGTPEPAPPLTPWPEVWSRCVADIGKVTEELHKQAEVLAGMAETAAGGAAAGAPSPAAAAAAAAREAASSVKSRLDTAVASQALRVPAHEKVFVRHAMRVALGRVADAVELKLQAVHEDYNQRLAEAVAAQHAAAMMGAGGPGAGTAAAPPSTTPDKPAGAASSNGRPSMAGSVSLAAGGQSQGGAAAAAAAAAAEAAQAAAAAEIAAAAAAAGIGGQWLSDKCRVGAKSQVKSLSVWLWEEVGKEKQAVADWLQQRIRALDMQMLRQGIQPPSPPKPPEPLLPLLPATLGLGGEPSSASVASGGGGLLQPQLQSQTSLRSVTSIRSRRASDGYSDPLAVPAPMPGADGETLLWARFALQREAVRLGVTLRTLGVGRLAPAPPFSQQQVTLPE